MYCSASATDWIRSSWRIETDWLDAADDGIAVLLTAGFEAGGGTAILARRLLPLPWRRPHGVQRCEGPTPEGRPGSVPSGRVGLRGEALATSLFEQNCLVF